MLKHQPKFLPSTDHLPIDLEEEYVYTSLNPCTYNNNILGQKGTLALVRGIFEDTGEEEQAAVAPMIRDVLY